MRSGQVGMLFSSRYTPLHVPFCLCCSLFTPYVPLYPVARPTLPLLCPRFVPKIPSLASVYFPICPKSLNSKSCLCILPYMPQLSRQASCPSSCASSQSPIRPSCPSRLSHWPVLVLPLFMEFNKVFYRRFLTNKDVFILLIPINTRV